MRIFLSLLITLQLFALQSVDARQVRVLSEKIEFSGKVNTTQRKTLILQNDSNESATYFLRYLRGNVGSSQNILVCIGDNCFDPRKDLSQVRFTLAPGEVTTNIYIEFELGITATKGTFDLHFFNTSNQRDAFVVENVYNVVSDQPSDNVNHKDVDLDEIYPNPSVRTAQLDYKIKNPNAKVRIVINSFIGNPIYDFRLDASQETLIIPVTDLNPGTYFYTLIVDNKNIVTKKLYVKR
ncbi:T9SS type A sorting domain-containing protein [uncultured Cyclobacterium sp.]|uniref:T9SS type A sorting domain-containing protein n=1 Tax=uncultured Cyclobacterium sp. TaxID=453820 RepID=UPI0030EDC805|tara:strand:+ start:87312 stop:88025 length:714 start_codon:yes stop_codon:yes gene_type:complete